MSMITATPAELIQLNAGFNPDGWSAPGGGITSSAADYRPPEGRTWTIVWGASFVAANTISLTLDASTGRPGETMETLTQAFTSDSDTTLEALRDQLAAKSYVLWTTFTVGSTPTLKVGFKEGYSAQVTGGTVTGGASQPPVTLTETTPGASVSGALVAAVGVEVVQGLATLTHEDVVYTARRRFEGTAGNSITIVKVVSGLSTPLSVSVAGLTITINLETDGGGTAVTTASQLVAAVANDADAMNLISVSTSVGATVQGALSASNTLGDGTAAADRTADVTLWGFLQNEWVWHTIRDAGRSSLGNNEVYRLAVGNIDRLYAEVTTVSGAGTTVNVKVGLLTGSE